MAAALALRPDILSGAILAPSTGGASLLPALGSSFAPLLGGLAGGLLGGGSKTQVSVSQQNSQNQSIAFNPSISVAVVGQSPNATLPTSSSNPLTSTFTPTVSQTDAISQTMPTPSGSASLMPMPASGSGSGSLSGGLTTQPGQQKGPDSNIYLYLIIGAVAVGGYFLFVK